MAVGRSFRVTLPTIEELELDNGSSTSKPVFVKSCCDESGYQHLSVNGNKDCSNFFESADDSNSSLIDSALPPVDQQPVTYCVVEPCEFYPKRPIYSQECAESSDSSYWDSDEESSSECIATTSTSAAQSFEEVLESNKAAKILCDAMRSFHQRKQQRFSDHKKATDKATLSRSTLPSEFIKMTTSDFDGCRKRAEKKYKSLGPRVFYVDSKKQFPIMWQPARVLSSISGGFSEIESRDNSFVCLTPASNKQYDHETITRHNYIARLLLDDELFCSTAIVDNQTKISVNGGIDLLEFGRLHPRTKLNVKGFHKFCLGVERQHQQNRYLIDIKPENIVAKVDGGRVISELHYIDFDSIVLANEKNKFVVSTLLYSSSELNIALRKKNCSSATYQIQDQYSLLITILESTCKDFDDALTTLIKAQVNNYCPEKSLLKDCPSLKASAEKWMYKHVNEQYRAKVVQFLLDPLSKPLQDPLSVIINWDCE